MEDREEDFADNKTTKTISKLLKRSCNCEERIKEKLSIFVIPEHVILHSSLCVGGRHTSQGVRLVPDNIAAVDAVRADTDVATVVEVTVGPDVAIGAAYNVATGVNVGTGVTVVGVAAVAERASVVICETVFYVTFRNSSVFTLKGTQLAGKYNL